MVGISHFAFRAMVRRVTPKEIPVLCFTEMLSTRRIPSEKLATTFELKTSPNEDRFIPQLLGNEERFIRASIEKLQTISPAGFDINMGCPVKHVLQHNWGVKLMGDLDYAKKVVSYARNATRLPVSVKLRAGFERRLSREELSHFCSGLFEAGADFLTIHARAAVDKHEGFADWKLVADVGKNLQRAISVNGGIQTAEDAVKILHDYRATSITLGRIATVRPWILWNIGYALGLTAEKPPQTAAEERIYYFKSCRIFLDELQNAETPEDDILVRFRFFVAIASKWLSFGHAFWKECTKAKTVEDLCSVLDRYETYQDFVLHKVLQ